MKSPLVIFSAIYFLLQTTGCSKDPIDNVTEAVRSTDELPDTTYIPDIPTSQGEIVTGDLTWITPWYNAVEVKYFNRMIPFGAVFDVFIQRHGSTEWNEVPLIRPVYPRRLNTNTL